MVAGKAMLELVTKRLNEMVAENDIGEGMKGKYLQVSKAEVTNVFCKRKEMCGHVTMVGRMEKRRMSIVAAGVKMDAHY